MTNNKSEEQFWYGASCAPYAKSMDWPQEEWEDDLRRMKEMNFTVARIFVPWDRIERREGKLDFGKQDFFLDSAEKNGIKVILNVGGVFDNLQGIYPPSWLSRDYPVHAPVSTPLGPSGHYGPRRWVCLDDPIYRQKAADFITTTVKRYKSHPALAGWMVWNEPWLGNCYCQASLSRFKSWLRNKYNENLDELNHWWGTEFPVEYRTWDEVEPPTGSGFRGGGLNPWRDWHDFNMFRMTDAMTGINQIIKKYDTLNHPTTGNICFSHGISGERVNLRMSEASKAFDILGCSYYTVAHGECEFLTPASEAMFLDSFRWLSQDRNKKMLVLETEVGPNRYMITPERRILNNWMAIGHNAKAIVCWNYRSRISDNQVANFNLMAWDGTPGNRCSLHQEAAATLNRCAPLLNHVFPEAEVGILMSSNLNLCSMATHRNVDLTGINDTAYKKLEAGRDGTFKLLWDMSIPSDGITDANIEDLSRYKLILLPMIENMTPAIAEALKKYVRYGGTLIAESPFAYKDENNMLHGKAPIYGLDKLCGAFTRDREGKESAPDIIYPNGKSAKVCFFWHPYELTGGSAAATYSDGRVAVVQNRYGKGHVITFGTEVFRQYMESNANHENINFLRRKILGSDITPNAEVLIDGKLCYSSNIEVCRLSGKPGKVYIILNHNTHPVDFSLKLRDKAMRWTDLNSRKLVNMTEQISLPGLGVLAVSSNT